MVKCVKSPKEKLRRSITNDQNKIQKWFVGLLQVPKAALLPSIYAKVKNFQRTTIIPNISYHCS